MLAPLFIKYKTNRNHYLYDCGTSRIMRVDDVIYGIIDDFNILPDQALLSKHQALGRGNVQIALDEIREAVKQGHLPPHAPVELSSVDVVAYRKERHAIGEFWKRRAALLVLGITERCNLCCSYCCFSGSFEGQRTHSQKSMTWEIAEKAISYFLENDQVGDGLCPITFYGGEPLLEFELVKRCVEYAESKAAELGKKVRFSVTTNGTLLDDQAVDWLVEHRFLTLISLDGPRAAHDRYRVFPDGNGSFRLVENNLRRFAERYPEYKDRGLSVTLAPPLDLNATAALIEELYPDYPISRVVLVNTGKDTRIHDRETNPTQYGCHSACKESCLPLEPFRRFEPSDDKQLKKLWEACVQNIKDYGITEARQKNPFAMLLFEQQIAFYHRRNVTNEASDQVFYIPCFPGFTRRFCDADGNYRVCERVDDSKAYQMGNVWDGPDPARLIRIMEMRRHFGDCGNCTALKTCDLCYARIPESDAVDLGFDPAFDFLCQQTRKTTAKMFRTYTEIMEANPNAFESGREKNQSQDKFRFGTLMTKPDEIVLSRMEHEEMPSPFTLLSIQG